MKIRRILPVAGILTLMACGAAFAQMPAIPPGAGVAVHRPPPGSRTPHHHHHHHHTKPTHTHRSATSPARPQPPR